MINNQRIRSSAHPVCAHPAWIEIDTGQFKKNIRTVRNRIGKSRFCLPVKANAYGHGLRHMAKLAESAGVDYLGVSCLKEALELRLDGIEMPILIFGAIHEDMIDDLIEFDLEFTISSKYKAELVARKLAHVKHKCKVHVEIDTGMQRTGVRPENALALLSHVDRLGCFEIKGMYSHLATAELPEHRFALQQIELFRRLAEAVRNRGMICHLANSGGLVYYPDSYFDMVRPGLICYGHFSGDGRGWLEDIRPCLSLKAKVSYFKVVAGATGIGYGHLYTTKQQTRIATIPVGYGDGYRRSLGKNGSVLIHGERFSIAGAICMDQFMVDIGDKEVYVGDEVVLIGQQENEEILLEELCRLADSIPHEMLCAFSDRLPRIYC